MIRLYIISIFLLTISCTENIQSKSNTDIKLANPNTIYFSREFQSQNNLYRLDIVQGDATFIDRGFFLIYPQINIYKFSDSIWIKTYGFVLPDIELDYNGKIDGKEGVIIEDINFDGIKEFFFAMESVRGFPPYYLMTSNRNYDTLIFIDNKEIRNPIFYPKYKVLSCDLGRFGKDAKRYYYTFDYDTKQLVDISERLQAIVFNDTLQEERYFSSMLLVD